MSKLTDCFRKQRVFSIDEAQTALNSKRKNLTRLLHYLIINGKVKRIRRGLYYVNDDETITPNPYAVAAHITQPSYLAFHTALELHGVAYSAFRDVHVVSLKTFTKFDFQGIHYVCHHPLNGDLKTGIEERMIENTKIRASDRERTVIDCLDRVGYAGGVEECVKSLMSFPSIDVEKILAYLAVFNRKILYAKVGWLFQRLQSEWHIDESILKTCEKNVSKRPMHLEQGSRRVFHERRWNLLLPHNLEALLQGV